MVTRLEVVMGGDQFGKQILFLRTQTLSTKGWNFTSCSPLGLVTLLLNLNLLMPLWKKEKTIVYQLMMIHCMMNILYAALSTYLQSPYFRVGLDQYGSSRYRYRYIFQDIFTPTDTDTDTDIFFLADSWPITSIFTDKCRYFGQYTCILANIWLIPI